MSTKNIFLSILVLIIVLIIWYSQNLFRTHRTELPLAYRIINLKEDTLLLNTEPEQLFLTVEGKGNDIIRLNRTGFYLEIDAANLRVGSNEFSITEQNIILNQPHLRGVLRFYLNRRITVHLDRSMTATFPVSLRYMTQADEDFFSQYNALPQPNRVEIVGPFSIVNKLLNITTVPVSVSDLDSTEQLMVDLETPEGILSIKPDAVSITLESPLTAIRTIPLITIQYPKDKLSMIIPQSVTIIIEGEVDRIQTIRPQMIIAQITIPEDVTDNFAPINLTLPDWLRLVDYTPQKVQIFRNE